MSQRSAGDGARYDAVVLDLDGVVTDTASLHFRAWKATFDAFLQARSGELADPFGAGDYRRHVDGKPRYEGVASFLASRGIELPAGAPSDGPERETVCGLGNRKNARFQDLLAGGVQVFPDAPERLDSWRRRGLRLGLATASRSGAAVLRAAGLEAAFDAVVDGEEAARRTLAGKPAPDLFLEVARRLGVAPERAVLVEDALSGVEAGRAGGFGLVVGIGRDGGGAGLRAAGADVVVRTLRELGEDAAPRVRPAAAVPPALADPAALADPLEGRRLAVFLDYDGTLTPIVPDPDQAVLSDAMRATVRALAARWTTVVVSGRGLEDVRAKVGLEELVYAGSHGFDIEGPELRRQHEAATAYLPALDKAQSELTARLAGTEGALVERKRFSIAVHYRRVAAAEVERVRETARDAAERHGLRRGGGKRIVEIQPPVDWDKGRAVLWLREALGVGGDDHAAIYVGDDLTDEDAFLALQEVGGLGVLVGCPDRDTAAAYRLPEDVAAVQRLLEHLTELGDRPA